MPKPDRSAAYRADIDGLRAIAVLSVIIFHVDVTWFSGGFVGVDIFFVISGFLITGNISRDIQQGRWSFRRFYIRRWRRLFPAYIFTLFASFVCAFLVFSPDHLERLCRSILFSMVYASNFFFWSEAGYFDVSSNFKPLLHLWSLGVEEQFYIVWPMTLFLLARIQHRAALPVAMLVLGVLSLLACEHYLAIDRSAVFYLLPFRVFEFALGGALTRVVAPQQKTGWPQEVMLAAGLVMVGYAVLAFDEHTDFPGLPALIPCMGTALIIYAGRARYLGILLRNRVSVGIGLVSYSAYLAHWPIVIFYKYWAFSPLALTSQVGIVAASFLIAYWMYRYIEQPFRYPKTVGGRDRNAAFLTACVAMMALIAIPAVHGWKTGGWDWRLARDNPGNAVPAYLAYDPLHCKGPECELGAGGDRPVDMLLIGDSHSRAMWHGFDYLGKQFNLKILSLRGSGCYPVFNALSLLRDNAFMGQRCKRANRSWEAFIETSRPRYVALVSRWALGTEPYDNYGLVDGTSSWLLDPERPVRTYENARETLRVRLGETVARINELGSKVILVSQVPLLGIDPGACKDIPTYLYSDSFNTIDRCHYVPYRKMRERLSFADGVIRRIAEGNPDVHAIMLSDLFCDDASQSCRMFADGTMLYEDDNHLNGYGAMFVARMAEKDLAAFLSGG